MRIALRTAVLAALAGAGVVIGLALLELPAAPVDLRDAVGGALDRSGVAHPVTAVLLNYRAFDTLLEVLVLLVALLGAHSATRPASLPAVARDPVLDVAARSLVPLMLLTAVYLLWAGATRPGGAFQGAAVAAAAGVLLVLCGLGPRSLAPRGALRAGLVAGPIVFLLVAVSGGGALLAFPPAHAGALILLIETALTVSLALVLWALFLCIAGADDRDDGAGS
jgi:Domain related to MnhB subunit of Na+/H+ antiporter.